MFISELKKVLRPCRNELLWAKKRLIYRRREFVPDGYLLASIEQPFRSGRGEAKLHNLRMAAKRMTGASVGRGEVFSFWRHLGRPTEKLGYRASRSLVGGELRQEIGGGLCQMAGLIYHLSLLGEFDILERHSHSIDIYREEERHTPLGLDAAVVFPRKDLIVRSRYNVWFWFRVTDEFLKGELFSDEIVAPSQILIARRDINEKREVVVDVVRSDGTRASFNSSYQWEAK